MTQETQQNDSTIDDIQNKFSQWATSIKETTKEQLSEEKLNLRKQQAKDLLQTLEEESKKLATKVDKKTEPMRESIGKKFNEMKASLKDFIENDESSTTKTE